MSILAYTLLAASGGAGGDGNFYAAFIGGTDYPKAKSSLSAGTTCLADEDGNGYYGVRCEFSSGNDGALYYVLNNSTMSLDHKKGGQWPNELGYPVGGGLTIGTQVADNTQRLYAGVGGQYGHRGVMYDNPSQWSNSANILTRVRESTTQPRGGKDSKVGVEDNRVLWYLGDAYDAPAGNTYSMQYIKFKQSSLGSAPTDLMDKGLGSNQGAYVVRGYSVDTNADGHQFIGGAWRYPASGEQTNVNMLWYGKFNHAGNTIDYLKFFRLNEADNGEGSDGVTCVANHDNNDFYISYMSRYPANSGAPAGDNTGKAAVAKINTSDGSVEWARSLATANSGNTRCLSITTDSDGNVYALVKGTSGSFGNQTDPTGYASEVQSAIWKINADGTFGWCNVVGGAGGDFNSWDEGKGTRLFVDDKNGLHAMTVISNLTWGGTTKKGVYALRVPTDGSGTSASAVSIGSTGDSIFYNTSASVTSQYTASITLRDVNYYSYGDSQNMQNDTTQTLNAWTTPTDHASNTGSL